MTTGCLSDLSSISNASRACVLRAFCRVGEEMCERNDESGLGDFLDFDLSVSLDLVLVACDAVDCSLSSDDVTTTKAFSLKL